jgi:hypothetical protein
MMPTLQWLAAAAVVILVQEYPWTLLGTAK